ncbi:hypothetical protein [Dactylosporangium cerinum]
MLPIASGAEVRAYLRRLIKAHPRMLALVVVLHVGAAVAGLVTPACWATWSRRPPRARPPRPSTASPSPSPASS